MGAEEEAVESTEGFPKAAPKARVTYWGNVSYQHPDPAREPTTVEIRYSHEIDSLEQVYVRHLTVDLSWEGVDTGWVDDPSLVVVKNTEPAGSGKELMLSFSRRADGTMGDILLPPGKAFVYIPLHTELYISGRAGETVNYSVTAIPK